MKTDLKLYVVMNKEGKFFRAKGYGGYGKTWVDTAEEGRIYTKLNAARSIVSFFANKYPQYGIPEIHQLNVTSTTVLDETKRVEKVMKQNAEAKIRQEKRNAEYRLKIAEEDAKRAQARLEELRAGNK